MKFSLSLKRLTSIVAVTALAGLTLNVQAQDKASAQMTSQTCPVEFFSLPLFPDAKMCQIFAPELPASLTYHASTDQQSTQQFYTDKLGQADQIRALKGRILMEYDDSNKIIIISKDGAGTQVDVLVKS